MKWLPNKNIQLKGVRIETMVLKKYKLLTAIHKITKTFLLSQRSLKQFSEIIHVFGVSVTILLGGANSCQTSIKYRDLACNVEPPLLKNCKDLTTKLEVKYLFPTSSSSANVYIYQLPECLEMRKY